MSIVVHLSVVFLQASMLAVIAATLFCSKLCAETEVFFFGPLIVFIISCGLIFFCARDGKIIFFSERFSTFCWIIFFTALSALYLAMATGQSGSDDFHTALLFGVLAVISALIAIAPVCKLVRDELF